MFYVCGVFVLIFFFLMSRRINPLLFRAGLTSYWPSEYSFLNYTYHLKKFLKFSFYLNSKLLFLNQIFCYFYLHTSKAINLTLKVDFKPGFCYKFDPSEKKTLFKVRSRAFVYKILDIFQIMKQISFLYYSFLNFGLRAAKNSFIYLYQLIFRNLFFSQKYQSNFYLFYYIQYCFYLKFYKKWFFFLQNFQKLKKRKKNKQTKFRKSAPAFFSKQNSLTKSSFFSENFCVLSSTRFLYNSSTYYFKQLVSFYLYFYFKWYKVIVYKLLKRFYRYWVFIKLFFFKYSLRFYLLQTVRARSVSLNLLNIVYFSKQIKGAFHYLPSITKVALKQYRLRAKNKKKLLFFFLISLLYCNINIFNRLVSYLLPQHTNQFKILKVFDFLFKSFYSFRFNLKSIVIKISGKFSGRFVKHKPKTRKITLAYGVGMPLQDLSISCKYATAQVNTRKGIFGVKTWFYLI